MTKVLVTGGNGFLGRAISQRLIARGNQVFVLGRNEYPDLRSQGIQTIKADLANTAALARAVKGIDLVFHVAAKVGLWGKWQDFYQTNFIGTRNLVEACLKEGVSRLVYTSTPSVVFNGMDLENADEKTPYPSRYICHYPRSKALAEQLVIAANGQHGLSTTALRPHLIWGPGDNHLLPQIIQRARKGKLIIVGSGTNKVDFTYIDNVADAHLAAANHLSLNSAVAGQCYFIGQDEPVVLWDFVNKILTRLNIPIPTHKISYPVAKVLGALLENLYRLLPLPGEPRITRFLAGQLAKSHYFSTEKAKTDFGYQARVSINEGIDRYVDCVLVRK